MSTPARTEGVTLRSEVAPVISAARREQSGVEPVLFWDKSTSTNWPAVDGGADWPAETSRRYVMREANRQLVTILDELDTEEDTEQAGGSDEMGGLLTFFFGSTSSKGTDLNPSNFDRKLAEADRSWGGGTALMSAWEQGLNEYDEEFGDKPEREQPVHLVLISTDGELDDMDVFEKEALSTAGPHRVFVVMVFGYDDDPDNPRHTRCLEQYGKIAKAQQAADPHGKKYINVVSFDGETDPNAVAADIRTMVS
jgi:hypothetical protein